VTTRTNGIWRVERALQARVGARTDEIMHKKTRHLANLSPHEVAQTPNGDRIVLAELDKIVLQAGRAAS
jgi:hypothetical protein